MSRFIALSISLALALTLAACGGGDKKPNATAPSPSSAGNGSPQLANLTPVAADLGAAVTFVGGDPAIGLSRFLGVPAEQLREELKQPGATQATLATKYGKTREALKAYILQDQKTQLDQAVQSGRMPKDVADQLLMSATGNVDLLIDSPVAQQTGATGPAGQTPGQPVSSGPR